jgi:hypothetical protein
VIRLATHEVPNGSVKGRLVDARGGALADTRVTLRREDWYDVASSRTDAAGRFSFETLSAGDYRLHGPATPRSTPPAALGAWTLQPGEELDVGAVRAPDCCPLVLAVENAPARHRLHVKIWNDRELCVYDERVLVHQQLGQSTVRLPFVLPAGSYRVSVASLGASVGTSNDAATDVSFEVGAHTSTVTVALP